MRRFKMLILMVLVLCVPAATAFAGRVQFSSISFSLGSLIASGTLVGLGNQDVTVVLDAAGIPEVTCTNQGGTKAPGQNPPKVSSRGTQSLIQATYSKNGTSPFFVEAPNSQTALSAKVLGCPNNNWKAKITFVYWTDAVVTVHAGSSAGAVLLTQTYACSTTKSSVNCKLR
jgi:hypothetical protein